MTRCQRCHDSVADIAAMERRMMTAKRRNQRGRANDLSLAIRNATTTYNVHHSTHLK